MAKAPAMYVADIEISNLRSFRGTQKISLDRGDGTYAGWTVFAGRNGAGKSTLVQALALSMVGPLAAQSVTGASPAWVRKGEQVAWVATTLVPVPGFDGPNQGTTVVPFKVKLQWRAHEGRSGRFDTIDSMEWWDSERAPAPRAGPWADDPLGWFVAGYGPYRRLGSLSADLSLIGFNPMVARVISLFSETVTLADAVGWLRLQHLRALEKKPGAAALLDAVVAMLADGFLPDGTLVDRVDSEGLWLTRDGTTLHLEQFSEGYRNTTSLVLDLLRQLYVAYGTLGLEDRDDHQVCPLPGVVLIDEVDAHLHVEWQQRLGFWLTSRFPAIQFLVTTHSPFICQAASKRGIIRLPAPGEDRQMEHIDDRLYAAIVNGGADDAVMTELFGLEHAHSERAERLRESVAALEVKVIDGTASTEEVARYEEDKQQLPENMDELADRSIRALLARGARP